MRKMFYITTFIIILLVSFLGITYSYEYTGNNSLRFELIGPEILYVDVNSEYVEYGVNVYHNNVLISDKVVIDNKMVNTSMLGEYIVNYSIEVDGNLEYINRKVIVIDKSSPVMKLKGDESISILLGGTFVEPGFVVTDNYDDDLNDKVTVTGSVDTFKEGKYYIDYSVYDSSGNKGVSRREVVVVKPDITVVDSRENIVRATNFSEKNYSNTIIKNVFTSNGIY